MATRLYVNVAIYTPLEFGTIGLAEEDAELIYGKDTIEVRRKREGVYKYIYYEEKLLLD